VRDYGHRLVQDHSKANERLHRIAVANGIEWPNSTDKKQAKTRHELSELSGDRFDKKFMKDMVKDHEKDIHDYQKAEKKVDNSQLQQYVQNTLPTLHEHLQLARQVRQEVTHEQHQAER
jgi:putative membrane protein